MNLSKSIQLLALTSLYITGCAPTAPTSFDMGIKPIKEETSIIQSPSIGKLSSAELGDSLVFTHKYKATQGFLLNNEHKVIHSKKNIKKLKKKNPMGGVLRCKISKLDTGFYVSRVENSDYVFYFHTEASSIKLNSLKDCENGKVAQFGFAQSKSSPNVYKSWYENVWNINEDKLELSNVSIEPAISEKGVFKQEFYYNGKHGTKIKFSYREFTDKGLARNSFSQEVMYDLADSSIIGFKGAKFEVIDATNTSIKYRVISHFK